MLSEPDRGVNSPVCSAEMRALAQTGKHIKVRIVHEVWCVTVPLISVCECKSCWNVWFGSPPARAFKPFIIQSEKKNPSNGHSGFDFNRVQVSGKRERKREREKDGWKVGQTQNCDRHDIILNVTEKQKKNSIAYFTLLFSMMLPLWEIIVSYQHLVLKFGLLRCWSHCRSCSEWSSMF